MKGLILKIASLHQDCHEYGHPIDLTWNLEHAIFGAAKDVERETSLGESIPALAALVVASPFDAALHDAFGHVHGLNCWSTFGPDFDKVVLGGSCKGHYAEPKTHVEIAEKAKDRPILVGFKGFDSVGALYINATLAPDCEALLTGTREKKTHPVAWTRTYKGGRVFYTSLGHQQDFQEAMFGRLLVNAVKWSVAK